MVSNSSRCSSECRQQLSSREDEINICIHTEEEDRTQLHSTSSSTPSTGIYLPFPHPMRIRFISLFLLWLATLRIFSPPSRDLYHWYRRAARSMPNANRVAFEHTAILVGVACGRVQTSAHARSISPAGHIGQKEELRTKRLSLFKERQQR